MLINHKEGVREANNKKARTDSGLSKLFPEDGKVCRWDFYTNVSW